MVGDDRRDLRIGSDDDSERSALAPMINRHLCTGRQEMAKLTLETGVQGIVALRRNHLRSRTKSVEVHDAGVDSDGQGGQHDDEEHDGAQACRDDRAAPRTWVIVERIGAA
jgi:hypothetical protein